MATSTWSDVVEGCALGKLVRVDGIDDPVWVRQTWDEEHGMGVLIDGFSALDADQAERLCAEVSRLVHDTPPESTRIA